MRFAALFIDLKRLLVAMPLLIAAAAFVYVFAIRDATGSTPRARLIDTPPGVVEDVGVHEGELARDFVGTAPDGRVVRLSDLRGRPAVINFWATWCTSCLAELPEFKRVQDEIGADRFAVVAVNAGESSGDAQEFLDELDVPSFLVGMDPTLVVADAYGVSGLPTSVFVDADGVVRGVYAGQLREKDFRAFVDAAMAASPAPEPDPQIRLITTVARDHTLEVRSLSDRRVDLRSKSLRCDDSYCASSVIDELSRSEGVMGIERRLDEDPPRIVVSFDDDVTSNDAIVARVVDALRALGDPLYERELEIVQR